MDQSVSGIRLPTAALSTSNTSMRSDDNGLATLSTTSSRSTGLEQDNESLRVKLRQQRDENARLIAANHSLQDDIETTRYDQHRMAGRLQEAEEITRNYKLTVAELRSLRESTDRERNIAQQQLNELRRQLDEQRVSAQNNVDALQRLHCEHDELCKTKKRVEGERDMALDSAERIQKAYEDFQRHVHERLQSAQQRLDAVTQERDKLLSEVNLCRAEMADLREEARRLTRDCTSARDAREELEQLNTELRQQLTTANVRTQKLESELGAIAALRRENSELKLTVEQQQTRLEHCQAEIGESRAQLGQLEDLAQRLQRGLIRQQKPSTAGRSNTSCISFASDREDLSDVESLCSAGGGKKIKTNLTSDLQSKLASLEADLQRTNVEFDRTKLELERERAEVRRLRAERDEDVKQTNMAAVDARSKTSQDVDESVARLEDEKVRLLGVISSLEHRVADIEASKAASDAQLAQRGLQLDSLRHEIADRASQEATLNRELRKRTLQIATLERQLDDKVVEISTQVSRAAKLNEEIDSLTTELHRLQDECDKKSCIATENAAACAEMRRLHDAQCNELETAVTSLSDQRQELESVLAQSDARCMALQRSLQDMTAQSNALRQELMRREQDVERTNTALEQQATQTNDCVVHLEMELTNCQLESNKLRVECDRLSSQLKQMETQSDKWKAELEETDRKLKKATKLVEEKDQSLEELEKIVENNHQLVETSEQKICELENEQVRLLAQVEHLEEALQVKVNELTNELDATEKKLNDACIELEHRDEQLKELSAALRSCQLERSRTLEELGGQLKTARKQLKQESRDREGLLDEIKQLRAELDLSVSTCVEKDAKILTLNDRVAKQEMELKDSLSGRKALLKEMEQLKSSMSEDLRQRLEEKDREILVRDQEIKSLECQLESTRASLKRCEDALRSKQTENESLASALQERQWELQQRAAQLTQLDMAMNDRSSDWDQRLVKLESALKKSRLETEQRSQQVRHLEEQATSLMASLKDKIAQVHEYESLCQKQASDLDIQSRRCVELERLLADARRERDAANTGNHEAENQLSVSRRHLETLQSELSETKSRLTTVSTEHDRLARDLNDAVALIQAKETEHNKLVQQLTEASEERSRLQSTADREAKSVAERHQNETLDLKRRIAFCQDEMSHLQQQVVEAGERQAALVVELRRMAQQLSSTQMELDASRTIANAQRETVLVREAEVSRLEAQIALLQRNIQQLNLRATHSLQRSSVPSSPSLPNIPDLNDVRSVQNVAESRVGISNSIEFAASDTLYYNEAGSRLVAGDIDGENLDSLQVMWRQLQMADRAAAGNRTVNSTASIADRNMADLSVNTVMVDRTCGSLETATSYNSIVDATATGITDPQRSRSTHSADSAPPTRLGNAFEEKTRIQNRIKALIGYREPAKKVTATKCRTTSRPGNPTLAGSSNKPHVVSSVSKKNVHGRSTTAELSDTSELSTAVAHYGSTMLSGAGDS